MSNTAKQSKLEKRAQAAKARKTGNEQVDSDNSNAARILEELRQRHGG